MSIQAVGWVLDQDIPDSASKLVLISIANALNGKSGKCCPALDLIAHESSVSRSTVIRKLKSLETDGWISVSAGFTADGRQTSNTYAINYNPHSSQAEGEGVRLTPSEGVTAMEPSGVSTVTPLDEPEEGTLTPYVPPHGGILNNDLFEDVWKAWPEAHRGDRETAGGAYGRLMPDDQRRCFSATASAVRGMLARHQSRGERFPRLATFIGRRLWLDYEDAPEIDKDGDFIITPTRPEWKEWLGDARKRHGQKGVDYFVKIGKVITPQRWPEGHVHG